MHVWMELVDSENYNEGEKLRQSQPWFVCKLKQSKCSNIFVKNKSYCCVGESVHLLQRNKLTPSHHFSLSLIHFIFIFPHLCFVLFPLPHSLFSFCGCCLCHMSRSSSPSDRAYWTDPSSYTVPYICPACQKLEQDGLKGPSQPQPQPQQQYEAQSQQPPSSQDEQSLPHYETLIT